LTSPVFHAPLYFHSMVESILQHAGPHLYALLQPAERRTLQATSKALDAFSRENQDRITMSLRDGHEWAFMARRFPRIRTLQMFPNTLQHVLCVSVRHLVTLSLEHCGLSPAHGNAQKLGKALRGAPHVRDFAVSNNPQLGTKGLSSLLASLDVAGATLQTLRASNTGIQALHHLRRPVLSSLNVLDVAGNPLSKATIRKMLRALTRVEQVSFNFDMDDAEVPAMGGIHTLSWCRCNAAGASTILGSDALVNLSLACRSPLTWTHLGSSIMNLALSDIRLSNVEWHSFLKDLAEQTRVNELVLSKAVNLSAHALVTFIDHLPEASAFTALGFIGMRQFTYDDLRLVCNKLRERKLGMRKWILSDCDSLKFPACAQDFIQTLHQGDKVYLDINTRFMLSLSRRQEALWISRVLASATFSYLGLRGRSVMMDAPLNVFDHVEQMSLESTEINWGFPETMTCLKAVSLYNVESRYLDNENLLEQLLRLPHISHVQLDYCRLERHIDFPLARYIHTLGLNWCHIEAGFRNAFLHAIVMGQLPALSRLGIMSSHSLHPSFVCLLVLAMKRGQRHCEIDARGHVWTVGQLKFLRISLHQVQAGDISHLHVNVHPDARNEMQELRAAFPAILFG